MSHRGHPFYDVQLYIQLLDQLTPVEKATLTSLVQTAVRHAAGDRW